MSVRVLTKEIWREMVILVFIFREVVIGVMDVGFFSSMIGMLILLPF